MDNKILVTIVLTVYKRTEYLEVALRSALAQTMPNFEIIIADDSGNSLAESIYKAYAKDKRIVYQANSQTKGIVNSIKDAIENSKGDFISVLNDDDYWEDSFLEKLVTPLCMDDNRILAFSDHWIINADGMQDIQATEENTKLYKRDKIKPGEIADSSHMVLIDNSIPLAMASVFRKNALDLNLLVPDVSGAYDFWISCLLAAAKRPFYYVNERLTNYRVHPQMETGRRSIDKQKNSIFIYKTMSRMKLFPAYTDYINKSESFYLYQAGKDNLYFRKGAAARGYLKNAIKIKVDYRYLILFALSYLPNPILEKFSFAKRG